MFATLWSVVAGGDGQLERVRRCLECYFGGYRSSFSIDKGDESGDIVLTKIQVRHSGPVPDAGWIRKKLYEVIVKELPACQLPMSNTQGARLIPTCVTQTRHGYTRAFTSGSIL